MAGLLLAVIYLAFVSLGLPDSLLGSGWPSMHQYFNVDSSCAGYVSMTISAMTIISALFSAKLTKKLTTKFVVIISIGLTIIGLLGFSFSTQYWMLFIFAVPYGLGAGSIDAALNDYVANHYSSRVMNFLHCFYGVGSVISPNIMALALKYARWNDGYRWVAYIQIGIFAICLLSIPLWKKNEQKELEEEKDEGHVVKIKDALKIPGVVFALISFFAYCSGEAICFLWTSSFFSETKTALSEEMIASFGSLIFGGLMLGRLIAGFISNKVNDKTLIRVGICVELIGIVCISIPIESYYLAVVGFLLIGTGMGPIYPSIQHLAPINFGKEASSTVIGLQMASAYMGSSFMPFIFGLIQSYVSMWLLPAFLLFFLLTNIVMIEISFRLAKKNISNN